MNTPRAVGLAAVALLTLTAAGGGIAIASDGSGSKPSTSSSSDVEGTSPGVEDTDVNSGPDRNPNEAGAPGRQRRR